MEEESNMVTLTEVGDKVQLRVGLTGSVILTTDNLAELVEAVAISVGMEDQLES